MPERAIVSGKALPPVSVTATKCACPSDLLAMPATGALQGGVLPPRVVALLVLEDRRRLDRPVRAGQPAMRKVAVDARHGGLPELDNLIEDGLRVPRAEVVAVDQDGESRRLPRPLPGRSSQASTCQRRSGRFVSVTGVAKRPAARRAMPERIHSLPTSLPSRRRTTAGRGPRRSA